MLQSQETATIKQNYLHQMPYTNSLKVVLY